MNASVLLEVRDLYAGYVKESNILNGLDLQVNSNEIVAIVGKNGSGKSTLAKAIMRITPYTKGSIKLNRRELLQPELKTDDIYWSGIGYFLQEGVVFNNLTVEENLRFSARKLDKIAVSKTLMLMNECFEILRDKRRKKMKASFLSGGEKKQLALAMVLMKTPKLLILDEPSAGLSPINRNKMFKAIEKLRNELKIGILLIEQNVNEAHNISDKMGLLQLGRIESMKTKQEITNIDSFFWN